ncbi:MAG: serine/threonine-protein phosphatase [Oscillospiraceae bacterium]|jgi:serine/threonine protein phosphatase PrpC|nr:serine/threonine-protein phosphatase [Oscillospiraceae bacterium]
MKIDAFTYTNPGSYEKNDDRAIINLNGARDGGIFVLADGLGGHKGGDVAAQTAADLLSAGTEDGRLMTGGEITSSFSAANDKILAQQLETGLSRMKTTAVLLHIADGAAVWAHIGDSRLYYISNGEIVHITPDQSVSYRKYASGEITFAGINVDEDRTALLRALGNIDKFEPKIADAAVELQRGDAFLLCSDGVWECLFSEEILIDRLKSETSKEWAEHMLLRHIRRARPGNDNYTLITVMID